MPFIKFVVGAPRYYAKLVLLSPVLLAYFARLIRNDVAKQIVLKQYLAGYPIDELYELGKRFSEEVIPTLLRPEGMERLRWHQAQGHQCVLVSASLEVYLTHWAKKEGFERVLATALAQCPDHRVTGGLEGNNCHGVAKADRIKKPFKIWISADVTPTEIPREIIPCSIWPMRVCYKTGPLCALRKKDEVMFQLDSERVARGASSRAVVVTVTVLALIAWFRSSPGFFFTATVMLATGSIPTICSTMRTDLSSGGWLARFSPGCWIKPHTKPSPIFLMRFHSACRSVVLSFFVSLGQQPGKSGCFFICSLGHNLPGDDTTFCHRCGPV